MTENEYVDSIYSDQSYQDACSNGLRKNTVINGRLWLSGAGKLDSRIMVITPIAARDEVATEVLVGKNWKTGEDIMVKRTPKALDYDLGVTLKDLAMREGLNFDDCYCVPLVRYAAEDSKCRTRPKKGMIDACMPLLKKDIERIKPAIIIAVGKSVFDALVPGVRLSESDIVGAWFYNKEFNCRIYSTIAIGGVTKPEMYGRYAQDFKAIQDELRLLDGKGTPKIETHYETIHNSQELLQLVMKLKLGNYNTLSVDCEWEGHQHVDGKLRSLQICWKPGYAAYIRFMDDNLNYVFDVDYKQAGKILGLWLEDPSVKYIGHHLSADLTWMNYWLGLSYIGKGKFDSEFALQACDEAASLGLDHLALRYTDFGKYDLELILWKKQNPEKMVDGYGQIPDDILIPYGCKDCDVTMRAYGPIWTNMEKQGLVDYYNNILNPMVTDVFTQLCLKGIPIDRAKIDEMRLLYNWAKNELEKEFWDAMAEDAEKELQRHLETAGMGECFEQYKNYIRNGKTEKVIRLICEKLHPQYFENGCPQYDVILGLVKDSKLVKAVLHFEISPKFNIRSKPQMQRWLFDVKEYEPVKSTSLKDQGMPAMAWEKVMALPLEKQKMFTPASDKSTLEILAKRHGDKVINALLELNAVGNICKSFLKPAEVDEDGNLIGEKGLHYWIASDNAIHCNQSTTETGKKLLTHRENIKNVLINLLPPAGEIRQVNCFNCWNGSELVPIPISNQAP